MLWDRGWTRHEAMQVCAGPMLEKPTQLEQPMAEVTRLAIGVDATPSTGTGWGRIVQDILDAAPAYWFRGQRRFDPRRDPFALDHVSLAGERNPSTPGSVAGRSRQRVFAIVRVGFGAQGVLD